MDLEKITARFLADEVKVRVRAFIGQKIRAGELFYMMTRAEVSSDSWFNSKDMAIKHT